jgi:hypothetical protein
MDFGALRLGFAGFWLAVAVVVYFRPFGLGDRLPSPDAQTAVLLAVALAGWNLSRWYFAQPRRTTRPTRLGNRLLRRDADRVEEYNPELDFTKRDASS